MLKTFIAAVSLLAIALALLAVKLFFKKPFVHTDIAGNKQLEQRGIHCVIEEEQMVIEKSKQKTNKKQRTK